MKAELRHYEFALVVLWALVFFLMVAVAGRRPQRRTDEEEGIPLPETGVRPRRILASAPSATGASPLSCSGCCW